MVLVILFVDLVYTFVNKIGQQQVLACMVMYQRVVVAECRYELLARNGTHYHVHLSVLLLRVLAYGSTHVQGAEQKSIKLGVYPG